MENVLVVCPSFYNLEIGPELVLRLAHNLEAGAMIEMVTSPYDVAEHLRTPEEMAAYLDACLERQTPMPRSSLANAGS